MPKESDWILYGSYTDKTFIRNTLAHDLWRAMGRYAVRSEFVELVGTTNLPYSALFSKLPPATRFLPDKLGVPQIIYETLTLVGSTASWSAPRSQFLNLSPTSFSTNEYDGLYVLMEKIKRNKHRVAIRSLDGSKTSEPEISGGYIFKHDRVAKGERGFKSQQGILFQFEEPKEREITRAQRAWLTNHINEFEEILFSDRFADPIKGYGKFIDSESFIDYHWIVEASRNMDGYHISQFYHKDRNGKINMGPIWDWDISFGNAIYFDGYYPDGWRWRQMLDGNDYLWFSRLFQDINFLQRYVDRWSELRTNIFATSNIWARIDAYAERLTNSGAIDRNYERWPTMGRWVYPAKHVGRTYEEEIELLKTWIKGRLEWIDSQDFPKPLIRVQSRYEIGTEANPSVAKAIEDVESKVQSPDADTIPRREDAMAGQANSLEVSRLTGAQPSTVSTIQIAWLVGTPYYTLDGTDPRIPGGSLSPKAIRYSGPFQVKPGDKLVVRSRGDADPSATTSQRSSAQNDPDDPRLWSAPSTAFLLMSTPELRFVGRGKSGHPKQVVRSGGGEAPAES